MEDKDFFDVEEKLKSAAESVKKESVPDFDRFWASAENRLEKKKTREKGVDGKENKKTSFFTKKRLAIGISSLCIVILLSVLIIPLCFRDTDAVINSGGKYRENDLTETAVDETKFLDEVKKAKIKTPDLSALDIKNYNVLINEDGEVCGGKIVASKENYTATVFVYNVNVRLDGNTREYESEKRIGDCLVKYERKDSDGKFGFNYYAVTRIEGAPCRIEYSSEEDDWETFLDLLFAK